MYKCCIIVFLYKTNSNLCLCGACTPLIAMGPITSVRAGRGPSEVVCVISVVYLWTGLCENICSIMEHTVMGRNDYILGFLVLLKMAEWQPFWISVTMHCIRFFIDIRQRALRVAFGAHRRRVDEDKWQQILHDLAEVWAVPSRSSIIIVSWLYRTPGRQSMDHAVLRSSFRPFGSLYCQLFTSRQHWDNFRYNWRRSFSARPTEHDCLRAVMTA